MAIYKFLTAIGCAWILLSSCIVSSPKFTSASKVMTLKPGMSYDTVNARLGLQPYYVLCYDSTQFKSYVYTYRLSDRKTVPLLLKETNGIKSKGKYMDLIAHFNPSDSLVSFESHISESKLRKQKIDINSIITAVTITVPSILVYIGISNE